MASTIIAYTWLGQMLVCSACLEMDLGANVHGYGADVSLFCCGGEWLLLEVDP